MKRIFILCALSLLFACGNSPKPVTACLDRPTDLSRAPANTDSLPCELLPPR
jgi:hypothetical protein